MRKGSCYLSPVLSFSLSPLSQGQRPSGVFSSHTRARFPPPPASNQRHRRLGRQQAREPPRPRCQGLYPSRRSLLRLHARKQETPTSSLVTKKKGKPSARKRRCIVQPLPSRASQMSATSAPGNGDGLSATQPSRGSTRTSTRKQDVRERGALAHASPGNPNKRRFCFLKVAEAGPSRPA